MNLKFYKCNRCGNVLEVVVDGKVNPMCCGKLMDELVPNTVDASNEKHVPVIKVEGNRVEVLVGEVEHPMIEAHFITNIYLQYLVVISASRSFSGRTAYCPIIGSA